MLTILTEHLQPMTLLAAKVVVDHTFVDQCTLCKLIDTQPGNALREGANAVGELDVAARNH